MFKSGTSLGKRLALSFTRIIAFMAFLTILSTTRIAGLNNEIGLIVSDQDTFVKLVGQSIIRVDEVTQQNAAMIEKAAAAAQTMHSEADDMSSTISVFKLGDDGDVQDVSSVQAIGHDG